MDASKLQALTDWLIDGGRSAVSPSRFMAECCERMVEAGLPLRRFRLFLPPAAPEDFRRKFHLKAGRGGRDRQVRFPYPGVPDFSPSPLKIVFQQGLEVRARADDVG